MKKYFETIIGLFIMTITFGIGTVFAIFGQGEFLVKQMDKYTTKKVILVDKEK